MYDDNVMEYFVKIGEKVFIDKTEIEEEHGEEQLDVTHKIQKLSVPDAACAAVPQGGKGGAPGEPGNAVDGTSKADNEIR